AMFADVQHNQRSRDDPSISMPNVNKADRLSADDRIWALVFVLIGKARAIPSGKRLLHFIGIEISNRAQEQNWDFDLDRWQPILTDGLARARKAPSVPRRIS